MEANRESTICIKGAKYKEDDVKFELAFRVDFGTTECQRRMDKIKAMGTEPANNCVLVCHEFETEEGMTKAAAKVEELKTQGMLGPATEVLEAVKKDGKKLIGCFRIPAEITGALSLLDGLAASLGPEFAAKNQYFEIMLSDSKALKDVVHDPSASVLSSALEAICIKLTLAVQKDLPIKIAEFVATLAPPMAQDQIKLVGQAFATFDHLKLDVVLRDPTEAMKGAYKDEMTMGIAQMGGMALMMATQLGVMDIAKTGGVRTIATLCFSPLLSFSFRVLAPTAVETLAKFGADMETH